MNGNTSLAIAITPYYTLLFVYNGNSSVSGIFLTTVTTITMGCVVCNVHVLLIIISS